MATQTNTDIAALRIEIEQLRDEMTQIAGTLREIASNDVAGEGSHTSAEQVWNDIRRQAGNFGREIEEKPIASALAAFGIGILAGLFLNRRR
jgi:ElaB/YqjD/DUF883 family membrane-anchored ribosome-binding protein